MVEPLKELYIHQHLGLGDHIICNGLVRNVYKRITQNIHLFCKPMYHESILYMYRDTDINIIPLDDHDIGPFLSKIDSKNIIRVGHHHIMKYIQGTTFDHAFYKQIGLDFKKRWTDFYIERDQNKEETLYQKINPPEKYIFLHDDPSRNFVIDQKHIINKNLKIIKPDLKLSSNIFEYAKVLENATEIHCIDSCFRLFADSFLKENKQQSLFFHFGLMNGIIKDRTYAQSRLPWKFI